MKPQPTTKPLVASKTLIVNALIGLAPLFPPVAEWVTSHPAEVLAIISVVNIGLRLITKDKVVLFHD